MKVFRGTPKNEALIMAGSYVSPWFERAVTYARYPDNGDLVALGYIFELEAEESEIDWDERGDCPQGTLRCDKRAKRVAVCYIPIGEKDRTSPTRIRPDETSYWANGIEIKWIPIE